MKKLLTLIIAMGGVILFTQCGPAAEDREAMHQKAKRVSDSIGKVIDDALNEVKINPSVASQETPSTTDTLKK